MPLAEKALIAQIRSKTRDRRGIVRGIGDDCAIIRIPKGHEALITTDFSLEGTHFRRDWHSPESVGHRCLARGLSDIAAMGGTPIAAFLSLAFPRSLPQKWVDRFLHGFLELADKFAVTLAGGDTAQSPNGIAADIVVLGAVPKGRAIQRSGARPGDSIYVSGALGGSAATVGHMMKDHKRRLDPRYHMRHFFPEPRLEIGCALSKMRLASAMIDLSDGLSTDLSHIREESGVGAELQSEAIPLAMVGTPSHTVDLQFALHGGEDYELLFTARHSQRVPEAIAGVPLTRIGRITRTRKMFLTHADGRREPLDPQGWEHFKR